MKIITINPYLGSIVNFDPIGYDENTNFNLKAKVNWTGTFTAKFYNSDQKDTEFHSVELLYNNLDMTLNIYPKGMSLPIGKCYYEVRHNESTRLMLKGSINTKQ